MNLMLLALPLLGLQDKPKVDLEKTRLYVYDGAKGITLKVTEDGKVEFTVPEGEEGAKKTYKADSVDEFRKQYPDVARKHGFDRYAGQKSPGAGGGLAKDDFERWWDELKKQRRLLPEVPEFKSPFDDDWQGWMEEQRKQFDELRKLFRREFGGAPGAPAPAPVPAPEPAPGGREFGIKVGTVAETLRDQLSLKEDEGVAVEEVKPGSAAEKAGLLKHDIILKIDGKAVTDKWQFRRDVVEALGKAEFELEVLRAGKRQILKVKGAPKKDE
jgi:hypothetical protein